MGVICDTVTEVTVELLNLCYLNCLQCSTRATSSNPIINPLEEILGNLEQFPNMRLLRPSGGEPFLYPHLFELVKYYHDRGVRVEILTCGVVGNTDEGGKPISEELLIKLKPYVDEIVFSYHGQMELHDRIALPKFSLSLIASDNLYDSVDNVRSVGIPFSFHTVVMGINYSGLDDIAKTLEWLWEISKDKQNIRWHWLRLVLQGNAEGKNELLLSKSQRDSIPSLAAEMMGRYHLDIGYSNSFSEQGCQCGTGKAVIDVHSDVYGCSALKGSRIVTGTFACKGRT